MQTQTTEPLSKFLKLKATAFIYNFVKTNKTSFYATFRFCNNIVILYLLQSCGNRLQPCGYKKHCYAELQPLSILFVIRNASNN